MKHNAKQLMYESYSLFDTPVIFSACRLDENTVPYHLYMYQLRAGNGEPCQLGRGVFVDFYGSILTSDPIQLPVDGLLDFGKEDFVFTGAKNVTPIDYLAERPSTGRDVMDFYIATPEEHELMFSHGEAFDRVSHTVGHLRGDFGSGKSFYTTWWPHNGDSLNTPAFKEDIDRVVNWLRGDSCPLTPLRDLETMRRFCRRRAECAKIKTESMESYGFTVETKRYRYALRCMPVEKVYNFYLYCYEKENVNG